MSDGASVDPTSRTEVAGSLTDVRDEVVAGQLAVSCTDEVALQLGLVGRTEDVAISPDGRRLAR